MFGVFFGIADKPIHLLPEDIRLMPTLLYSFRLPYFICHISELLFMVLPSVVQVVPFVVANKRAVGVEYIVTVIE